MTMHCARCRRPLTNPPVLVGGHGYGPACAAKVGDLLSQKQPRSTTARRRKRDERQDALFLEARG